MEAKDVTLAIPCYNVAEALPETLEAVLELKSSPANILCVDDGSTDDSIEVIRSTPGVDLIQHEDNKGLAAARNTALEQTETDGLAMLDADVVPDPDWLEELTKEISRTNAVVVGGRTEERVDTIGDEWRNFYYSSHFGDESKDVGWVYGANALYETSALRDVQGWDEQYRTNYEDVDIGERLTEAGYELRYTPSARAEHNRTDSIPEAIRGRWNWFYRGHREPDSATDFITRPPYHAAVAAFDFWHGLRAFELRLLPITMVMPIFWIYYDFQKFFES